MSNDRDTSDLLISLTADESIVLFELLSRFFHDSDDLKIIDQAEESALNRLFGRLEEQLVAPFQNDYRMQLQRARKRLRYDVE